MEYLSIKNWEEYQHYKDRCPPWIKLHVKILNDRTFATLSAASRGLLMQLWILASENDGKVPNDLAEIKFRLRDDSIKEKDINLLIEKGFLSGCKQVLADDSNCSHYVSVSVSSLSSSSLVLSSSSFDEFWKSYPKKVGKGAAKKAWKKITTPKETLALILKALEWQKMSEQWTKDKGQFIPNPATYLNEQRWEDEPHGNANNGGVNDNLFLRTIREENERAARRRLVGCAKELPGCGDSESGAANDGGVSEDANSPRCDSKDHDKPEY